MRSLTEFYRLLVLFYVLAFTFPAIAASSLSVDTDGDGIEDSQDADDDGDGVLDEADFDPVNFFLRKDSDCDGLANYYDTDKDNDGLFDSERLQILGRNTTGGGSGVRLKLAADVPDGQLNLNFRIDASEWVHKQDSGANEWAEYGLEIQPWIDEVLRLLEEKGDIDSYSAFVSFFSVAEFLAIPIPEEDGGDSTPLEADQCQSGLNSVHSDKTVIGRMFLQTTSSSNNVSFTHIINNSDQSLEFIGTIYGSDGTQLGGKNVSLNVDQIRPGGRLVLASETLEDIFLIDPWTGPAMIEVRAANSFRVMTRLRSPSGLVSNTNCVTTDQVDNVLGFDESDMTYIRFINIGETPITNIRGSLLDSSGNVIGSTNPILIDELAAKAHVWKNRNQLSDLAGDTWNGTASLKIENADDNLRLLNLNFINNETFFNFSCYESGQ